MIGSNARPCVGYVDFHPRSCRLQERDCHLPFLPVFQSVGQQVVEDTFQLVDVEPVFIGQILGAKSQFDIFCKGQLLERLHRLGHELF